MAQIVKLRRSSVSGQKPTNSNLQLGELALNTTDGKVYMAVSGSLGPSVEELISTNTVNTGSIFITGNVTASNFSGSFKGDGSQLYNIPSSGVTGLELNKIVDGSATASISQTDGLRINTKTEITGSVVITQDLTVSGSMTLGSGGLSSYLMFKGVISSSLAPDSDGDTHYIGGPIRRWAGVYGKTGSFTRLSNFNTPSSSLIIERASVSGSFTGSYIGDGTGLYNIPFRISGSDVEGNQSDKTFTKLHFDSDTGLNVSESAPGTAFISIGSHFKDIFVSGSPILSATGSDAFEIIPTGGVEITTSITDTNGNGYVKELNISTTTLSSSLNNRMDTITGSITTLSSSVNSLNTFTSSVVLTSQTSSMNVLSASYALTAAFALNAGAGGGNSSLSDGAYAVLNQTTPATTWTFKHNLGQRYPIFQVFDSNGSVILPSQITTIDINNATITFPSNQTGKVIASLGTGPGGLSQYFSSNDTWSLAHNLSSDYPIVTIWDTNRNIIFPQRIESVDTNNIKIYFSTPIAGYVNVAKGGHIISGSVSASSIDYTGANIVSGSGQIVITGTTGYSTFSGSISSSIGSLSSSVATTTLGLSSSILSLSSSVALTTSGLTSTITTLSSSLSSSIDSLSSSVASINNTQNGRLDSLETASGSIRSNFNTFTSSYNTGSFTGSFKGDGTNLYNIPASGVTGLELYKIVSGSVSASISPNNGFRVNTDVYIDGSLTAKELFINYISSSVLYQSGSTKFGDTSDDNHSFTGSVLVNGNVSATSITGSINFNNLTNVPTLVSGSSQIFTGYDYEIHVSQVDGNDTTGNGGLLTPVASITKALTLVTGQRRTVVIHPGSYTESPSITTQYTVLTTFEPLGGNTAIIGTVSTSVGCTIVGLAITNLTITAGTGVGVPNIINCNITGTLTKSGNATFTDIHNCDIGTACNITGTGLVTINDGNPNFVTVNNAGANVIIKNTMSCVAPSVIAGTLNITDSVVIAAVTNAVTSNASSVVTLANSQFLTSALNNVAPVSLSGFYSIFNCVFDKPNSTLVSLSGTGGSTNSVDYFQYIDADNITTKGLTVTGSINVTNGITGSIDYSNITNKPTLVSGSSQIDITGTTGYSTFSSSVSSSIGLLSSSIATTTSGLSSSIDSLSSSVATTTLNLKNRVDSIEGITGSISSLNTYTGSNNTVIGTLQTATGSLNTFTSSAGGRLDSLESASGSIRTTLNSYTSSNDSTNTTQNSRLTSIEGITGSISSLNSFTASINTTIKNKLDSENVVSSSSQIIYSGLTGIPSGIVSGSSQVLNGSGVWSGSAQLPSGIVSGSSQIDITGTTGYSTFSSSISTSIGGLSSSVATTTSGLSSSIGSLSSSIATTTLNTKNRVDSIESKTGSYATTGSNIFQGSQTITGSLFISQDLIVAGSSSIQHVSSSILNIADNIITVNALNPSVRFGGLAVIDSGSSPQVSGSILFDSVNNQWLFVHQNQASVTSSVLLMGPETYNNVGNESYITSNRLVKSTGIEHLTNSNISDDGTTVTMLSNTVVNGTFSATGTTLVSGSSQITFSGISGLPTLVSGSSQISYTGLSNIPSGIVSGSSQIDLTATTNYASGILTRLNAVGVFSGSAQVTGIGNAQLTNSSVTVTAGTGMSGGGAVSLGGTVTLTNAGVTSITTNTGLSSNVSATGAVTITNTITNNNQLTNGAGYITSAGTATNVSGIVAVANGGTGASTTSTARTNLGLAIGSDVLAYRTFGTAANSATGDFAAFNATTYVGTTAIALNRASASQTLTGVSIDGNAATVTNFSGTHSGTSSGTNTGDETLARVNALAITTVGTITSGTWNGTSIGTTYTAAKVTAVNAGTGVGVDTTTGSVTVSIGQAVGTANAPTFAGGTINGSLYVNANNDVTTLAGSLTLYSSGNATSSMIMFKNTTGLGYGNHGAITGTYNTYFVMDTTDRGWIFRNATTSGNVASISNTGVISATRFTTSSGQTGTMSGNAYPVSPNSYFGLRHGSMGASSAEYMIISANADTYISCATGSSVYLRPNGNNSASGVLSETGAFRPETNNSINLGTASYRWQTVYMMDLSLSNGIGDYTIVEGEEKLYLYNNKNNKVYSFVLQEEDPTTATPKMS